MGSSLPRGALTAALAVAALALAGCASLRDNPTAGCTSSAECAAGQACYRGFCIAGTLDAATPEDAGTGSDDDADVDAGGCPGAGVECTYPMPGRCSLGITTCRAGGGTRCSRVNGPQAETCNGADDDCDGTIDNDAGVPCFTGDRGCSDLDDDGQFECEGACRAGVQECVGGALVADCTGQVLGEPADGCTTAGGVAVDSDCDGSIDEECTCTDGERVDCYTGSLAQAGRGACALGHLTCAGGSFGACEGSVPAQPETCANVGTDDDCNDVVDDVPGTGAPCETGSMGVCADGLMDCRAGEIECVGPSPADAEACDSVDDDCDGNVDEGFDFASDEANCGGCGLACGPGQTCCGGACESTAADPMNCGGCGVTCDGAASQCCGGHCAEPTAPECTGCPRDCAEEGLACCDFACVDTSSDSAHCGAGPDGCGVQCEVGQRCCGGTCVGDSELHCGSCTACEGGARCCGSPGARSCAGDLDPANCNGCGIRCGSGTTCCDSGCANVTLDEQNCGACGRTCGTGQECSNGLCCAAGLTNCGGACVDLQSSGSHCGVCGRFCALGCSMGSCRLI